MLRIQYGFIFLANGLKQFTTRLKRNSELRHVVHLNLSAIISFLFLSFSMPLYGSRKLWGIDPMLYLPLANLSRF